MSAVRPAHLVTPQEAASPGEGAEAGPPRSSIGGAAWTASGEAPKCGICDATQILFFQLELEERFGLGLEPGSQLCVWMCPEHNEALLHPALHSFDQHIALTAGWPEHHKLAHASFSCTKPSVALSPCPVDTFIEARALDFEGLKEQGQPIEDSALLKGAPGFKIGGFPMWRQTPRSFSCACGAPMTFVAQVPSDCEFFRRKAEAPEQPNTFSGRHYALFLGNRSYVFVCSKQCEPDAVWVINQ